MYKDLEEIMDEMLEFDSKIGIVIDCGVCNNDKKLSDGSECQACK